MRLPRSFENRHSKPKRMRSATAPDNAPSELTARYSRAISTTSAISALHAAATEVTTAAIIRIGDSGSWRQYYGAPASVRAWRILLRHCCFARGRACSPQRPRLPGRITGREPSKRSTGREPSKRSGSSSIPEPRAGRAPRFRLARKTLGSRKSYTGFIPRSFDRD